MPLRRHLTFANVASATALVVALAGSGAAVASGLARNSVGSPQIKNGQVKNADLAANAVTGPKVAANAVTGAKVAPDSLTGVDIKESTLTLPAGARVDAGNANASSATLTAGVEDYATVDAVAPAAGFLLVIADAEFQAKQGGTGIFQTVYDGDTQLGGSLWSPGPYPAASGAYTDHSQTLTVPVAKGVHHLSLRLSEYANGTTLVNGSTVYLPHLTAVFLPTGTAGTPPIPD